jgi:hypothetical protein
VAALLVVLGCTTIRFREHDHRLALTLAWLDTCTHGRVGIGAKLQRQPVDCRGVFDGLSRLPVHAIDSV